MRAYVPLVAALVVSAASGQVVCERLSFPWSPWPLLAASRLPECGSPGPPATPPPPPAPPGPPPPPETTSGLTATPYPLGDLTYDDVAGSFVATDGYLIAVYRDPAYVSGTPPIAVFNAPTGLGPLTGLACDAAAGVLWCTDGFALAPAPLSNPTFTLLPASTYPFLPLGFQITGLDRDPYTGDLVGCDQTGALYRFNGLAQPIGPQPWRTAQPYGAASDVALRRHPSSRFATLVQFRAGGTVIDYDADPWCPSIATAFGLGPFSQGEGIALASRARVGDPQLGLPQTGGLYGQNLGTTRPPTLGGAPFACYLELGVPFYPVYFMLDFVYADTLTGPTPWSLIPLATPRFVLPFLPAWIAPAYTDANGRAEVAASLNFPPSLAGLTTYAQWAHPFSPPPPAADATSDLSALLTIELTLP